MSRPEDIELFTLPERNRQLIVSPSTRRRDGLKKCTAISTPCLINPAGGNLAWWLQNRKPKVSEVKGTQMGVSLEVIVQRLIWISLCAGTKTVVNSLNQGLEPCLRQRHSYHKRSLPLSCLSSREILPGLCGEPLCLAAPSGTLLLSRDQRFSRTGDPN